MPWVGTYEEERIGEERVCKECPSNPASGALARGKHFRDDECDDNADEFVARVGEQVEELGLIANAEKIHCQLETDDFEYDHR